jgi:hypothetical protein
MNVYAVVVPMREDGLYIFRDQDDAADFLAAVQRTDAGAWMDTLPLISHGSEALDLVTAELEAS